MRHVGRALVAFLALSTLMTARAQDVTSDTAQGSDDVHLHVLYTGRLFGYFRQELTREQQECLAAHRGSTAAGECSDRTRKMGSSGSLQRVADFWKSLPDRKESYLLLGMGDNLSPQLGSRMRKYWWDGTQFLPTGFDVHQHLLPQKAFAFHLNPASGLAEIEVDDKTKSVHLIDTYDPKKPRLQFAAEDNVANFFLLSGYDAVIPGREDFLYGALWLQQLATRLAELRERQTVRMLAANLRVAPVQPALPQFAWIDPNSVNQTSKRPCPLFFSPQLYSTLPPLQVGCDRSATSALFDSQRNLGYADLRVLRPDGNGTLLVQVIALVDGGVPGQSAGDLLREVANDRKRFWVQNNGQRTQYEVIVTKPDQELQNILAETSEVPYDMRIVLAQMPRASALQLASSFGRTNKVCVLSSAQDGTEEVYAVNGTALPPDCTRKTLPAIDLVISGAQDGYETRDESITYVEDLDREHGRAYLVTPHSGFRQVRHTVVDPLASVLFRRTRVAPQAGSKAQPRIKVSFNNTIPDIDSGEEEKSDLYARLAATVTDCGLKNDHELTKDAAEPMQEFEFCVLRSLQRVAHANVAMLQRRDFYVPTILKQDDEAEQAVCQQAPVADRDDCLTQIMFGRFLWKDDTPTIVNLTGAQLKAALGQSQALRHNDARSEVKDVSQEWLVTAGVVKSAPAKSAKTRTGSYGVAAKSDPDDVPSDEACRDASAQETNALTKAGLNPKGPADGSGVSDSTIYCINGTPINDAQLYKVVTSKALVENNAVFPGIATRPPGQPGWDEEHDVTAAIGPTLGRAVQKEWQPVERTVDEAAAEANPANGTGLPAPPSGGVAASERMEAVQQQRRLFHASLQNGEASYSQYNPNVSDVNLVNEFGGVADSRASSPSNSVFAATDNFRALEEGQYFDWGALQTLDFSLSRTGNQQGGFPTISFASNNFTVGPLFQLHVGNELPGHPGKRLPTFKITISPILYQQQVWGNRFAFNFNSSLNVTTFPNQARFKAAPQRNLGSRIGLRREFNDGGAFWPDKGSYYEVGFEHNSYTNVLNELDFDNGGALALQCVIVPTQTFTQCVKNAQNSKTAPVVISPQTTITGVYTSLDLSGLYLDTILSKQLGHLKLPTNQALSILVQAKGDYFFRHNYADKYTTQAYYAFTSSIGLQVPVWGNISLVPSYGAFFYENLNTFNSLIAKSVSVDLRWTFDHYTPVRWASDLSYTNPPSAGPGSSTASGNSGAAGSKRSK